MRWLIGIILSALAMMIVGALVSNEDLQVCGFLTFLLTGAVAVFRWLDEAP